MFKYLLRLCLNGRTLFNIRALSFFRYCYDLNRRAIVNLRDCLECSRIHRDGNVLGLPPKNLRIEGVKAINRGNQRRNGDFSRPFAVSVVSAWGESRGQ
jgi:hypothetical protein